MEKELKQLKKSLDEKLYDGKSFPEHKKQETYRLIRSKRKNRKPLLAFWKIVMPSITAFGIVVLLIFTFWQDKSTPSQEINQDFHQNAGNNTDEMNQTQEEKGSPILNGEPINILFTRTQTLAKTGEQEINRAMVLSIHPNQSIRMLNIDTRLNLTPNLNMPSNMTDLLQTSGMDQVQSKIEDLLKVKFDYRFDFTNELLSDLINQTGEITVSNSFMFTNNGVTFPVGELKLNAMEIVLFEEHILNDPYGNDPIGGADVRQTNLFLSVVKTMSETPEEEFYPVFEKWLTNEEIEILLANYLSYNVDMDLMGFVLEESKYDSYVEISDVEHNEMVIKELEKPFEAVGL